MFKRLFPTSSAGDGRVRENNAKTAKAQGYPSSKKTVRCKQCGFRFNRNSVDHKGGSFSGDGGYGAFIDGVKDVKKGAGCPLCGTKNGA
jgi:hypothetical protein